MIAYERLQAGLRERSRNWLITGVAGFIGSNILERLLSLGQRVVGLDNFSTGYQHNLDQVRDLVAPVHWKNFRFTQGDVRNPELCGVACDGIDYVIHQAALGSVPRSIEDPVMSASTNITGFLNMLVAAKNAGVKSFVYASSSSVYGDHPAIPKTEDSIGEPLSPYAVTKWANEKLAAVFARCYGFSAIGLRYFNVFGPRQDPEGSYAAVIPRWIAGMIRGEPIYINGDGETSRDFCYVSNAVQANLLAAAATDARTVNQVYNVAVDHRTTLNELFGVIRRELCERLPSVSNARPTFREFRAGDVQHSQADISKASALLGYSPSHTLNEGLRLTIDWYVRNLAGAKHGESQSEATVWNLTVCIST